MKKYSNVIKILNDYSAKLQLEINQKEEKLNGFISTAEDHQNLNLLKTKYSEIEKEIKMAIKKLSVNKKNENQMNLW